MDEQPHHIDRLFKKAVEQHSELPSSKVWENLEKNLQRRNATSIYKKYKKWKWVAAALFIFSVALGMYTFHLNSKYKKVPERKHINDSVNNTGPGFSTITKRKQGDKKLLDNVQGGSNENQKAKSQNIAAGPSSSNTENIRKKGVVDSKKIQDQGTGVSQTLTSASVDTRRPGEKIDKLEYGTALQKKIELAETRKSHRNSTEVTTTIKGENTSNNKTFHNPTSSMEKEVSSEDIYTPNASIVSRNIELSITNVQIPANVLTSPSSLLRIPETAKAGKSKVGPFSVTVNRGRFTGSLYYSQNFISTKMQPNNPDFREDNYLQIKSHEKMHAADVVGLSLVRNIGKRLGVETGVSLHKFTTDIIAKPMVARRDNNGKINYRISSSSGYAYYAVKNRPTPPLADTIRTISSTSTIKYISVPIGLQYHFYAGRKLSVSPAIALSTNFLTQGKITTIQSLEHTYTSDIEGLRSHYFDGCIRLNICYYLSKRLGISLVPSSSFALSDVTETKPVITRRNTLGVAAGLNFSFW